MMPRMKLRILPFALIILVFSADSFAGTRPPKGAIKLPAKNIVKKDGLLCGLVKKKWVSGKKISGGYFYSYSAERSNILVQAKQTTGKKQKSLKAKAASLKLKSEQGAAICASSNNPTPTATPSPSVNSNSVTPTATPTATLPPPLQPLRFDFTDASGVALKPASLSLTQPVFGRSVSSSNLQRVNPDGSISSATVSGRATIRKFLIAPNNKLYILFSERTNLADTTKQYDPNGCLLAEVNQLVGEPTCIDNTLQSIAWDENSSKNPPIQFDASGAIFYSGQNAANKRVLRKNISGTVTDLINDNIELSDFLVLPDSRVIITGYTGSSSARWIRRISSNGGLTNLYASTNAQFIRQFPDGNVYLGTWGQSAYGVVRYLTQGDAVDSRVYIIGEGFNGTIQNPVFDAGPFCDNGQSLIFRGFCGYYGSFIKGMHRTTSNRVFVIAGYNDIGELMEYYPTLARSTTVVKKVSVSQGVLNQIILAGLNSADKNVMTLFNTDTESEIQLIGVDNEIEVYRLNFSAAQNAIFFDGLRFSDNRYVIGKYDLNTMSLAVSSTGNTKLEGLQTFN